MLFGIQKLNQKTISAMKNSIYLIIIILLLNSCASMHHAHLPKVKEIDTDFYGGYIDILIKPGVKINKKKHVKGELIAIDDSKMLVYMVNIKNPKITEVNLKDIKFFKIYYAKGTNYAVTSLLPVSTITHGIGLLLTLPVNIAGVLYVNISSQDDFTYNKKNIKLDQLKMFARFPQGLPPNVKLEDIKPARTK